ncbi:MAG: hypothetical protein A3C16_00240 [Candidatus Sungbacteria bacterium RIFCSPHIGHO2_02_FULL_51_29]|uniref:ADP-ribosylglycohydrolase n=1 Tax=Candidatus Sungbacteria bacterium RIFCSPHIGHO2_02_FULL_51_29 TaxID=1802273 RepID=A0A1G2KT36_9BACT|nr:MAG: hypothetical protein A3C16_00240 [Candidatus Sungbacteria bacterium RIFCSPHIGHO2_02_FULL_51_29]
MPKKHGVAELRDKVRGCLVGTAVGDALGMPCEMMTRSDREQVLGKITEYRDSSARYSRGLTKGQWTDDTRLTLATAQGFTDAMRAPGGCTLAVITEKTLVRYIEAYREHKDRGFGKTTRTSLEDRMAGRNPHDGRNPVRPGNGCAMKSAILGVYSALSFLHAPPMFSLEDLSGEIGLLTHHDARSLTAGLIQALAAKMYVISPEIDTAEFVRYLRGGAWMYEREHPELPGGSPTISDVLSKLLQLGEASDELIADMIKTGGAAYESFPTALAYAIKYKNDFRGAVLAGANAGGDTDTIAAMAGALVGARLGMGAIPAEWIQGLEAHDEIIHIADEFFDAAFALVTVKTLKGP